MSPTFIFDKFSALVRWSNLENNKNFPPYIKKNKNYNFFLNIFENIYYFGLMTFFYVSIFQKNSVPNFIYMDCGNKFSTKLYFNIYIQITN